MTSRSGRGRWERVLADRRQARVAQGRDPDAGDLFKPASKANPAPPKAPVFTPIPHPSERTEYVVTVGEAAARLGISPNQLDVMIDAGKIEALPTGFTCMVPTREVERLRSAEES
jgi:hypothetical protein